MTRRVPSCSLQPRRREQGGTFLGLVIGVLLGLAVALAVAVYITKVPVPFVDRSISRPATDGAAEAERNKNWNPNAILGGKAPRPEAPPLAPAEPPAASAASAASAAEAKAPEPKPDPKPTEPKATKPATEAVLDAATAPKADAADPVADIAKAKAKTYATKPDEPAAPAGAPEPFTYFVQVGAFRSLEDAQAQRAKLMLMGLDAKISEREQNGRTVYRVRLGPYERMADAEKMAADLGPSGMDTALVRVQR